MFPKLVEIGPVTLHTYGLLLAVAYIVAIALTVRLAAKDEIPKNRIWDLGFIVILSAILGSKLFMVITDFDDYAREPSRFFSLEFWQAAGVFYGGLIGAVLGSALYVWKHPDLPFWRVADAAAPAIALGQSIGRLGCFSAGCCYGKPTTVLWAVTFTNEYAHQYVGVPLNVPLHPTQLYESLGTLVLFVSLWFAFKRRKFVGQVFSLYLIGYGILRFILEFYRGDPERGFVFGGALSFSQLISLIVVALAVLGYFYFRRKEAVTPAASGKRKKPAR